MATPLFAALAPRKYTVGDEDVTANCLMKGAFRWDTKGGAGRRRGWALKEGGWEGVEGGEDGT